RHNHRMLNVGRGRTFLYLLLGCSACGRSPMDGEVQRHTHRDDSDAAESNQAPSPSDLNEDAGTTDPGHLQPTPGTSIADAGGASSSTPPPSPSPAPSPSPTPSPSPAPAPTPISVTPAPTSPVPDVTPGEPLDPAQEVCNPMGFCWAQPQPFGDRIVALHGNATASTVFAVNAGGALLERSGEAWHYHDLGPGVWVQTVHVVDENDVWAGTADGAYQWRDGRWTRMRDGSVLALATDANDDVWMVTSQQVLRWDSAAWHDETP